MIPLNSPATDHFFPPIYSRIPPIGCQSLSLILLFAFKPSVIRVLLPQLHKNKLFLVLSPMSSIILSKESFGDHPYQKLRHFCDLRNIERIHWPS